MIRLFTYGPAIGLLGLATYQALYQQDYVAAVHTFGQAGALFGIGTGAHSLKIQR